MRRVLLAVTLIGGWTAAAPASADPLAGLVRIVGSAESNRVIVTPAGQFNGPLVCPGDSGDRIRRLSAMQVELDGDWKTPEKGEKCLEVKSIKVLKTTLGHDALVGTFAEANGAYTLTTDDGKVMAIPQPNDGLKRMAGKKLIVDVKPAAKGGDGSFDVLTYIEFP